jgi:hypothetical protein
MGTQWDDWTEKAKRYCVVEACKMANAHEFISQLLDIRAIKILQRLLKPI